jgi:hypothetical protein
MPALADIRAVIKTRIETVADIGKVNDYERYAREMSALKMLYVANIGGSDQLRGWYFRRATKQETYLDLQRWVVVNNWTIRGFMALDDSAGSEKTFDDLVEAVCDKFDMDPELITGADPCEVILDEERGGVQVPESGPVLFAGVLCHSARLTLATRHWK